MLIIIIIIIIILIILINKSTDKLNVTEGYDAKYSNISIDDCADFCKTTANCYGFGYDVTNRICYPSNQVIFGKPFNSIYADKYNDNNFICNKVQPIIEPDMTPAFHSRKTNAMFSCGKYTSLSPRPTMYMHDHGRLNKIFEGQNPDFITAIDEYSVYMYIWPNNVYEGDQLDRLGKDRDRYFRPMPTDQHPLNNSNLMKLHKVNKIIN